MTDNQQEVAIIGAGIIGICCALSLLERGVRVRLIDRDEPGQGASLGNAGVVSPWSSVPQSMPGLWKSVPGWLLRRSSPLRVRRSYLPRFAPWGMRMLRKGTEPQVRRTSDAMDALVNSNMEMYRQHLAGTGYESLIRDSSYIHCFTDKSAASLDGLGWRIKCERGAEMQVLDGKELRAVEPALSPHYKAGIIVKGQSRMQSPGQLCIVLAEKAKALGAAIERASVTSLTPHEAGWQIATDGDTINAATVIIAAGAWSAHLLKTLGIAVSLEAERGYHLEFSDPGVDLSNSIMDMDGYFVTSAMSHAIRSAGTSEFGGLDSAPDFRRAQMLNAQTKRMLPDLNTNDVKEWSGVRPSFPDSLPALGPVPGKPGLFAAFGHSHYGLGMAPATGRIAADLVTGRHPNIDLGPYRVDRF